MKRILILLLFSTTALAVSPAFLSFNAGQVSPSVEARSGFDKYLSSCRILENMLVYTHGPITRRPGTQYVGELEEPEFLPEIFWPPMYIVPAGYRWGIFDRNCEAILAQNSYDPDDDYEVTESYAADISSDGSIVAMTNNTDYIDSVLSTYNSTTGEIITADFEPGIDIGYDKTVWDVHFSADDQYIYAHGGSSHSGRLMKFAVDGTLIGLYETDLDDNYLGGGYAIQILNDDEIVRVGGIAEDCEHYQPHIIKSDLSEDSDNDPDWDVRIQFPYDMCVDYDMGYVYVCGWSNYLYPNIPAEFRYYCVFALSLTDDTVHMWKYANSNIPVMYSINTYNGYVYVAGRTTTSTIQRIWKLSADLSSIEAETSGDINSYTFFIDTFGNIRVIRNPYYCDTYSSDDLSFIETNDTRDGGITLQAPVAFITKPVVLPKADTYIEYLESVSADSVRLIPVEISTDDSYVLSFGGGFMGFYRTDANGEPGQVMQ